MSMKMLYGLMVLKQPDRIPLVSLDYHQTIRESMRLGRDSRGLVRVITLGDTPDWIKIVVISNGEEEQENEHGDDIWVDNLGAAWRCYIG